jgi:hypothetical protein
MPWTHNAHCKPNSGSQNGIVQARVSSGSVAWVTCRAARRAVGNVRMWSGRSLESRYWNGRFGPTICSFSARLPQRCPHEECSSSNKLRCPYPGTDRTRAGQIAQIVRDVAGNKLGIKQLYLSMWRASLAPQLLLFRAERGSPYGMAGNDIGFPFWLPSPQP